MKPLFEECAVTFILEKKQHVLELFYLEDTIRPTAGLRGLMLFFKREDNPHKHKYKTTCHIPSPWLQHTAKEPLNTPPVSHWSQNLSQREMTPISRLLFNTSVTSY